MKSIGLATRLSPSLFCLLIAGLLAVSAAGCPEPKPKKSPPIAKIPKRKKAPRVRKATPPKQAVVPAYRKGVLPPRVAALAKSGSPKMQALIAKAGTQDGIEAAKTWIDAGTLAETAREYPSALDLFQLAQQVAPKYCDGHTRARKLVTDIGKHQVAMLILTSEMACDGANKTALKAEAERLQELIVVDEHAHQEKKKGAKVTPGKKPAH